MYNHSCTHACTLTCGVASPGPSGLVPDGQAVLQEAEMSLLLPRAGLDFSQSRPCHHPLDVRVIVETWDHRVKGHDHVTPKILPHQKCQAEDLTCSSDSVVTDNIWTKPSKLIAKSSQFQNNIYSREPSGSIVILESCQWTRAAKKKQMSANCSRCFSSVSKQNTFCKSSMFIQLMHQLPTYKQLQQRVHRADSQQHPASNKTSVLSCWTLVGGGFIGAAASVC